MTHSCLNCGYDISNIRVDDVCPECGIPVWNDMYPGVAIEAERANAWATAFAFQALAALVFFPPACIVMGVFSIASATKARRKSLRRHLAPESRNMPQFSMAMSILAMIVSVPGTLVMLAVLLD